MRVICKADSKIGKLWGEGTIQPAVYRLLTYCIPAEAEDGILLHNAVTGELIFLDREEMEHISSLPCHYAPWMDGLIRKHFLVQAERNDKSTVDTLRLAMRTVYASKAVTDYTILPTTGCNARCFYCYEAGCRQETMSDETADRLVDFMDVHRNGKPLHLSWFGGEPLLGVRQIDRICAALKQRNIDFSSSMTSNGYPFDKAIAGRAGADWKLEKIQITLDGTEKVYNETKAYAAPCPSPYRRVLDNIGYLLQSGIRVNIRLNLGLHNADDLNALVREVAAEFEEKALLGMYVHILFEQCGLSPICFQADERALLKEKKAALEELIRSFAAVPYKGKLPKLKATYCMADKSSSVTVLPSGMLGKCEHYLEAHFVGSLDAGITDAQELNRFAGRIAYPECAGCPSYPACIKLKMCEAERVCYDMADKLSAKDVKRSMRLHYEAYLRGEQEPNDTEYTPDC